MDRVFARRGLTDSQIRRAARRAGKPASTAAGGLATLARGMVLEASPRTRHLLGSLLLAGVTLAGCGSAVSSVGPNTMVDDWAIGDRAGCDEAALCAAFIEVATQKLNGAAFGHAPVVEAAVHDEGLYPNLDGDLGQIFRGGAGICCVVLFKLTDGTYRAIGVGYVQSQGPSSAYPLDTGPGVRQEHTQHQAPAPTI